MLGLRVYHVTESMATKFDSDGVEELVEGFGPEVCCEKEKMTAFRSLTAAIGQRHFPPQELAMIRQDLEKRLPPELHGIDFDDLVEDPRLWGALEEAGLVKGNLFNWTW